MKVQKNSKCRWAFAIVLSLLALQAIAQGHYAIAAGEAPAAGTTITSVSNITMTYGAAGDADFLAAIANEEVADYTAFTNGNGVNPSPNKGKVPTAGTFYVFQPAKAGTLEIAVFHHTNNKQLYILEDGQALSGYNGIVVSADYKGTYAFSVKAGSTYHAYCSGSKMGFYGFKYTVEETTDDPVDDPDEPTVEPVVPAADDTYDTTTLSAYDANSPLGFGAGVTGGNGQNPVTVTTASELEAAIKGTDSKTIFVDGQIVVDHMLNVGSNKSILGLPEASIQNPNRNSSAGIFSINGENVIVRNIIFLGPGAYDIDGNDNITLSGAKNIWIDHCDIQDGMDGNLDIVNGSDNVCVSWTRFRYLIEPLGGGSGGSNDHRNCNLIGNGDTNTLDPGKLNCTFVSCWWDEGCHERCPRVRYGKVHIANCLYTSSVFAYCIGYGANSNIYAENCDFHSATASKYYAKAYNKSYDYNITVTGCVGGNELKKQSGSNTYFMPSDYYTLQAYSTSEVYAAVSDEENGAGATLDLRAATATVIDNIGVKAESGAVYNLRGQRVSTPFRGIYIKNGKKYIQ